MKMKMENDLTRIRAIIHHQPESFVARTEFLRYELDRFEQFRHYIWRSIQQVAVVLFRTNQKVGRCSGKTVVENYHLVVLVENVSRRFFLDYVTKYAAHTDIFP